MLALLLLALAAAQDVPDLRTRKGGADWPGFLGPAQDSSSPEKGLIAPWPAGGPRVVWTRELEDSYGMPSTSLGRLFLFDGHGRKARLLCLKAETGEELWRFEYDTDYADLYGYAGGPRCCPVVHGDRVYVYGVEGRLHCLRVVDGTPVWKADPGAAFGVVQNFFGVGSTPVVEGDLLLVMVGGSPPGSPTIQSGGVKGNGSGIVAYDKRSGELKYRIGDELASYATPVTATIGGRRWAFAFMRGGLLGFEPSTGAVDFHFPWRARILESVNASNPVVSGDRVFISEAYGPGGALLKVRAGGVDVLWKSDGKRDAPMAAHWMTPVLHEGFLYGSSGRHSEEAELRCVELETGKVRWSRPGLTRASLLKADGHLVCLGEDGGLRLLKIDPGAYREVSAAALKDGEGRPLLRYPAWAAPILSQGLMYVRGKDRLVCLEACAAR